MIGEIMTQSEYTVRTKLGALRGIVKTASDGQEYYAFYGVPFAKSPVGERRFKAPQPLEPWSRIFDATVEGEQCVSCHPLTKQRVGSEDCLNLNIYTHSILAGIKKPVMVFVHGGSFTVGSNKTEESGPEFFMCEDVVLVTVNYRLGIFGFLAFHDKSLGVPGNAGLKDQVMALRWVQQNIECFGGDPNNVTLFGGSAGAASVNLLQCSPMAFGLFHKLILQSGSALNCWTIGHIHHKSIATHLNMEGRTEKEILEKLMTLNEGDLLTLQQSCRYNKLASNQRPIGPVIEGLNPHEPSFLVDDPMKVIQSGNYIKVPMIIGFNSNEGMIVEFGRKSKVKLLQNFNLSVPYKYGYKKDSEHLNAIGEKIRSFYYGVNNPGSMDSIRCYRNLITDTHFLIGIFKTLRTIMVNNSHPIYFYRFDFDGDLNLYKKLSGIIGEGVAHSDEIFYMFKTALTPAIEPNSREAITIQRMVKYWTNFAKTSNPNPVKSDHIFNIIWPRSDGLKVLNISDELTVMDLPETDRMCFWDKIELISKNKL